MILENTIKQASQLLKSHNIASYALDAEIILSDIMGVTREFLIINNHASISKNIIKKYKFAIKRRINREPIAYITGKKEFWSEDFVVNDATLIPRPETELLIYAVINFFKNKRINMTLHKLEEFLSGDAFEELSQNLRLQDQKIKLANLKE